MYRLSFAFLALLSLACGDTIVSGGFGSHDSNDGGAYSAFQNFQTGNFLITFIGSGNPSGEPFFPVRCNADPFSNPCTIAAATNFSASYTNLTEAGIDLTYNGSNYQEVSTSGVAWQLNLTYTPTSDVLYGPLFAVNPAVLYNVTGSFTFANPSGPGFLIDNDPLTGSALATIVIQTPTFTTLNVQSVVDFGVTPEPASWGLVMAGLAAGFAARRRRLNCRPS
jgi:hypothetical protein